MTHQIRPIDGNALLKDVNCRINDLFAAGADAELLQCLDEETKRIKSAPTLDYAPAIHARWILCVYGDGCVHATLCGHCGMLGKESNKYCPTCGAVMDLPKEYREER